MADIYNAFVQGRQNGEARRTKRTLSQHLQGALGGDQAALTQIYQADPNAGMSAQKLARDTQNDSLEDVAKAAQFFGQTRDPKAYAYMHQRLSSMPQFAGLPATIDTPEDQEGAVKFAQAIAQTYGGGGEGNNVQSRFINKSGEMVALMRDGTTKVVGEADASNQIIEGEGGFYGVNRRNLQAAPVQLGGGQPQMPPQGAPMPQPQQPPQESGGMPVTFDNPDAIPPEVRAAIQANPDGWGSVPDRSQVNIPQAPPGANTFGNGQRMPQQQMPMSQLRPAAKTISPAEERRLQLAEEAAARAREAADRSRFGNAPAGFRFNADGTALEAIPGGPKPAGSAATEDERKAAGWLTQSRKAYDDMEAALAMDTEADTPGILETYVPIDEVANRSRSPARQKYVQGSSAFSEAVLRAATGAGVNRDEAIQKIREVTPQRGDSDAVKAQKRESLRAYLQSLEQRAGRAATGARPAATPAATGPKRVQSAADYDALPSGALFLAPDGTQRRKR